MSVAPAHGHQPQSAHTGLGPSIDEIHAIQRAQAAHARVQQIERLGRQFPVIGEVIAELDAAKARIVELETQLSGSAAPADAQVADESAETPKVSRRGRKPKAEAVASEPTADGV